MKKIATDKKHLIAQYTAVAGAFIASSGVSSQIVYVDINPDFELDKNNSPYSLDLNWDATNDIYIQVDSYSNTGSSYGVSYAETASFAKVAGVGSGGALMNTALSYPMPVASGNLIGSSANFGAGYQILGSMGALSIPLQPSYNMTWANGSFLGLYDQYLGVKFIAGANTHYGWIRLDVDTMTANLTVRIKDFAFNPYPSTAIEAGQMVGLENVPIDQKAIIKTHIDEAFVNVTPDLIGGNIVITDMNGREVKSTPINDVNTKVTYAGIDSGIYMIVARFEEGVVSKKIYVR